MANVVSQKRRKSIAAVSHDKPTGISKTRRRAHSMAGVDSPLARARRLNAPRKSILKAPVSFTPNGRPSDDQSPSNGSWSDDTRVTETMELTRALHDTAGRKSLGRRVSFAEKAHVRKIYKHQDGSFQSDQGVTDENDYPGAQNHRRNSVRQSFVSNNGSDDMDMTNVYDFPSDEGFSSDLDKSELETVPKTSPEASVMNQHMEELGDLSRSESDLSSNQSAAPTEYSVSLEQALNPANQDPTYMALVGATHAGISDDMGLDDGAGDGTVLADDRSAPMSLDDGGLDDSEDSSGGGVEDLDNQTLNLSKILGRPSFGGLSNRTSLATSAMDISDITANTGTLSHSTPRPSMAGSEGAASPFKARISNIFRPPSAPPSTTSQPMVSESPDTHDRPTTPKSPTRATTPLTVPKPFTFSQPSASPVRSRANSYSSPQKAKSQFTAAFAPPVSKTSPRKSLATSTSANIPKSPKRARDDSDIENIDIAQPNPAKRQALADKWQSAAPVSSQEKETRANEQSAPKPLSPSKRAPFQAQQSEKSLGQDAAKPATGLRRPSSYLSRRKSFIPVSSTVTTTETAAPAVPPSKQVKAAGRMSVDSGPSDAHLRFNRDVLPPNSSKGKQKASPQKRATTLNAARRETETIAVDATSPDEPEFEGRSDTQNMELDVGATEQWRAAVEAADPAEEDVPPISIEQFFAMTNIKFMDELTAPRRSIHPSHASQRQPRPSSEIPLAEFAVALGVDLPQLGLYTRVARDLDGWISQSKNVVLKQAEEEAMRMTPELFVEYVRADDEGQADILHQLNLIRANTRYHAKSDWYDWKTRWVEELISTAEPTFQSLTQDAETISDLQKDVDKVLPDLQQKYEQVMTELDREQAEVTEIENSDQDYLKELKASIAEQNLEVESLRGESSENTAQLEWLRERLQGIDQEKKEAKTAITRAGRMHNIQNHSAMSDVYKLKDELEALEDLHLTTVTKVLPTVFEFVYASSFRVTIPCRDHVPITSRIAIRWEGKAKMKFKDDLPGLHDFFMSAAQQYIARKKTLTTRQIVQTLRDFWSSTSQLRLQLRLVQIKYPLELYFPSGHRPSTAFRAKISVLFPELKAKAFVTFDFDTATFAYWPATMDKLSCHTETLYGKVGVDDVLNAVKSCLGQFRPESSNGCLLDACFAAQTIYAR